MQLHIFELQGSEKEGVTIWYIVQCRNQKSQKFFSACREYLSGEALQDVFVITYDRMRRYEGSWHLERQFLFPDYVFLESQDKERLTRELEKTPGVRELLPDCSSIIPLKPEEEAFLRSLCGVNHHLGMSRGVIRDGQPFVTEGPLRGKEQLIRRIDRHKRMARVEIPSAIRVRGSQETMETNCEKRGQKEKNVELFRELQMGLEIVSKS